MLRRLRLLSFRCHPSLDVDGLGPRVLLTGPNGRGKTSILEAVAVLARQRSFRTAALRDLARQGATGWRVEGSWADEAGPVRLAVIWRGEGRELEVDGRSGATVDEFWGRALAVVAHGGDTLLLDGGALERRAGMDLLLAELEPHRLPELRRLRHVVRQRAALVRQARPSREEWEAWTTQLTELGDTLRPARAALGELLVPHLEQTHRALVGGAERFSVRYQPSDPVPGPGPERDRLWDKERERGLNLAGPQRDDWEFLLGGKSLAKFGSEGQRRTGCLALRLAELQLLVDKRRRTPVLLVDDALKELDPMRREAFWRAVPASVQVLYATAHDRPAGRDDSWVILEISPGGARLSGS